MSYVSFGDLKNKAVSISQACRVLHGSRSGCCSAARSRLSVHMACAHSVTLKVAFAASGHTYGSRRLCAAWLLRGMTIGRYRARSLMRTYQLRSARRRKFIRATDIEHTLPVAVNVLNHEFVRALPDQALVSAIT